MSCIHFFGFASTEFKSNAAPPVKRNYRKTLLLYEENKYVLFTKNKNIYSLEIESVTFMKYLKIKWFNGLSYHN